MPVNVFIRRISESCIPSNVMSIERCNANIETTASASDIFHIVIIKGELSFPHLQSFTIASVIFVNV